MKKRIVRLMAAMAAVVLSLVTLAACGGKSSDPAEIQQKIDAKGELSQQDYAAILDYCGDYAKKAQQYYDIINAQPNDSVPEYTRAEGDLAMLIQKYPYLDSFRGVIYNTPLTALDADNQKKVDDYSKYQGFPLPDGAGVNMVNPDVEGDIEDMPDTDTGNVIATGDGEVVNENVK